MTKIEIKDISVTGWRCAIEGLRLSRKSNYLSDTEYFNVSDLYLHPMFSYEGYHFNNCDIGVKIGEKDLKLIKNLIEKGSEHRKFLRLLHIQAFARFPLYVWMQYATYKVATTELSESATYTLFKNEFNDDDFLIENESEKEKTVKQFNDFRDRYRNAKTKEMRTNIYTIARQLLPSGYMQGRIIDLNYETMLNIYHQRKNHKHKEWIDFLEIMRKELPYFEEFI